MDTGRGAWSPYREAAPQAQGDTGMFKTEFSPGTTIVLAAIGLLSSMGVALASQEALWQENERRCHGDLDCMLAIVEQTAPIPRHRARPDRDDLYGRLRDIGRFQQLGLTDEEGGQLVDAVFQKLLPEDMDDGDYKEYSDGDYNEYSRGHRPSMLLEDQIPRIDGRSRDVDDSEQETAFVQHEAKAEFQELEAVLMRWPFDQGFLRDEWAAMVDGMSRANVTIWMWVDEGVQAWRAERYLRRSGIPTEHISWVVEPTNSIWMRDYGPHFIYDLYSDEWGVVDFHYYDGRPDDDDTPIVVSELHDVPLIDRQTIEVVYTEGGNIAHDGLGTVIYSERTYDRNPGTDPNTIDERIVTAFQAPAKMVLKDPSLDATGHVDMFMKIVNEDTVLVGQYDSDEVDHEVLEYNAQLFADGANGIGEPWNVIRIPQPDVYFDSFVLPIVRTYTNSLLVNDVVLLPVYGIPNDTEAVSIYEREFPDREIIPINAESIIRYAGAWHCVTMEFPEPGE